MNNSNELQLASTRARALAFVIDDFIVTAIIIAVFWDSIINISDDMNAMLLFMQTSLVVPLMALKVLYQAFFVWYYGATIGKMIAKIRVIDTNTWQNVPFFSALLRAVARIFSEMFFYIGFIVGFFNEGRKTFHDLVGKTLVVNA